MWSIRFAVFFSFFSLLLPASSADGREASVSARELSGTFEALNTQVSPAVVHVIASGLVPRDDGGHRFVISRERSTGSGVIVDPKGYIVTNAHVVRGASTLKVQLSSDYVQRRNTRSSVVKPMERPHAARLVGVDPETDIAVLKIDVDGLAALPIADSDNVRPGQLAFAFGSPFGLAGSVSLGIVSSVGRQIEPDHPMVYIQTDAPINPGNSGGPLVNSEGQLIGINTFILSQSGGSDGLGFSVPSNIVKAVYQQLRAGGRVVRGTVGLHPQTITPVLAAGLGLPRDWGVLVADVYPRSPSEAAGVEPGDIILTLNDKPMENGRQFDVNVYRAKVGSKVRLRLLRNRAVLNRTVEVEARPDQHMCLAGAGKGEQLIPGLGVLVLDMNPGLASRLGPLRAPGGVVVVGTAATSALSGESGFLPGDIIRGLNTMPVESIRELRSAAASLVSGESAVIRVERGGRLRYLPFELE